MKRSGQQCPPPPDAYLRSAWTCHALRIVFAHSAASHLPKQNGAALSTAAESNAVQYAKPELADGRIVSSIISVDAACTIGGRAQTNASESSGSSMSAPAEKENFQFDEQKSQARDLLGGGGGGGTFIFTTHVNNQL